MVNNETFYMTNPLERGMIHLGSLHLLTSCCEQRCKDKLEKIVVFFEEKLLQA